MSSRGLPPALSVQQPRHAHRRPELPGLCLLLSSDLKRAGEISFRLSRIRLRSQQSNFPGDAIDLGFAPRLLRCFCRGHRFANVGPGLIELTNSCLRQRQI